MVEYYSIMMVEIRQFSNFFTIQRSQSYPEKVDLSRNRKNGNFPLSLMFISGAAEYFGIFGNRK